MDFDDPGWLLPGLWPGDAYGVIAAEAKAGKTWLALDLALSIATGKPFLGYIEPGRIGPVLMYLGEGNRRSLLRRLRAVCASKNVNPGDVHDLHLVVHAPELQRTLPTWKQGQDDWEDLDQIAVDLKEIKPVLVVLDPLYLSLGAVNMASLSDVGKVLREPQHLVEAAGAALVIVHHWNQTGRGTGFNRMAGAGPEEWGRALWTVGAARLPPNPTDEKSVVDLIVQVRGSEIADGQFAYRRTVWAEDPDVLSSPMFYEVTAIDPPGRAGTTGPTTRDLVEQALGDASDWMSIPELERAVREAASDAGQKAPKKRTVQQAATRLHDDGRVDRDGEQRTGYRFRLRG